MNNGPNRPFRGGNNRRRRRRPGQNQQNQGGGGNRGRRNQPFTGPMDHSYRQQNGNQQGGRAGFGPGRFQPVHQELEPLPPQREDASTRIFGVVEDLFFVTKIQDTARKLNVKLEFAKGDELLDKIEAAEELPALVIFDLNNLNAKPLTLIPKIKAISKKISVVGFLSHIQGDLKLKAQQAGCDMVVPRSAFSQNLPQLLRRHAEDLQATE